VGVSSFEKGASLRVSSFEAKFEIQVRVPIAEITERQRVYTMSSSVRVRLTSFR
jgi:hypothetical protein